MAHAGRDRSSRGVRAALVSGPEDDHGFEKLALPHLAYLYRLAVRLQGNARDAEGVVQETYERALKAFPSLRQSDRIRPTATSRGAARWRLSTIRQDFLARFSDDDVRAALLALPEEYRVPLVLFHSDELSYRELAARLGCPVGTVMSRLYRARRILERTLWECAQRRGFGKGRNP